MPNGARQYEAWLSTQFPAIMGRATATTNWRRRDALALGSEHSTGAQGRRSDAGETGGAGGPSPADRAEDRSGRAESEVDDAYPDSAGTEMQLGCAPGAVALYPLAPLRMTCEPFLAGVMFYLLGRYYRLQKTHLLGRRPSVSLSIVICLVGRRHSTYSA